MLRNYMLIALRNFQRHKVFSFINVLGLTLGLTCSLFIFLWVKDELSYDQFHQYKDQLYVVLGNNQFADGSTEQDPFTPANLIPLLQDRPEVQQTTRIRLEWQEPLVMHEDKAFRQTGLYVDESFLTMFSFPLLQGNAETVLDELHAIILSESLAEKFFDKGTALGQVITIVDDTGERTYTVTGVVNNMSAHSSLQFDFLIPFEEHLQRNLWLNKWGSFSTLSFVQLHPESSWYEANKKVEGLLKPHHEDKTVSLYPFSRFYLHASFDGHGVLQQGNIIYLYLFSAVALFVLLIACINFINLATARATRRSREVGIRKVAGARRHTLTMQFMVETFFLTAISAGLAILSILLLLPSFNTITGKSLHIPFEPNFILSLLTIVMFTGLLAGSYPSWILSSFSPIKILKGEIVNRSNSVWLRQGLVVFQFTLTMLLMVGTFVVHQQIDYIQQKNPGLDRENVIYFPAYQQTLDHFESFRHELLQQPGIQQITRANISPIQVDAGTSDVHWQGKNEKHDKWFRELEVDYNFLETFGMELITGRTFSSAIATDSSNYLLNEAAVRYMELKDPIGQPIESWQGKGQIIGVVKDFHHDDMHKPIEPLIIMLRLQFANMIFVRTQPGQTSEALTSISRVYEKHQPDQPLEYHFLDESFAQMYTTETRVGQLTNYFTLLAIIISCLGLLGLSSFMAEQRTKEIGIRKVLGAPVNSVLWLLSKDYIKLILIALLIAIPVSNYFLTEWLHGFAYKIEINWWLFAIPGILIIIIALLSVSGITLKAARRNPVDSLKYE